MVMQTAWVGILCHDRAELFTNYITTLAGVLDQIKANIYLNNRCTHSWQVVVEHSILGICLLYCPFCG
jgi:hypothetical protein